MNIVIVGGGTAGWLSALFLSKAHPENNYTVIESSKTGVIGTGEGSTAAFQGVLSSNFFDFGCNTSDFVKFTNATPKLGIKFKNWTEKTFFSPIDGSIYHDQIPDPLMLYAIFNNISPHLTTRNGVRLEKNITPFLNLETLTYNNSVAWHFDGQKVGQYFKSICSNITVIDSIVKNISRDEFNNVSKIVLENQIIENIDLVIDCTGFNSLFKLESDGLCDYSKNLPVNCAIPFQIPNDDVENTDLYTEAIAMKYGWVWKIPVGDRYGAGYVFNSDMITTDQAIEEASKLFKVTPIKIINFKSSRLEKFWNHNVIRIGLSSGFLEPLQATAIHTMIAQLHTLTFELFRHTKESTVHEGNRIAFNIYSAKLMDNFADLINLHYKTNRTDSEFWKYMNSDEASRPLVREILEISKYRLPSRRDLPNEEFNAGANLYTPIIAALNLVKKDAAKRELDFIESKIKLDYPAILEKIKSEVISTSNISMKDFIRYYR